MNLLTSAQSLIERAETVRTLSQKDPARAAEILLQHPELLEMLKQLADDRGGMEKRHHELFSAATNVLKPLREIAEGQWRLKHHKRAAEFWRGIAELAKTAGYTGEE